MNRRHGINVVVLLGRHTDNTLTATVLCHVGICRQALNIARLCECDYTVVLFDEILKLDVIGCGKNLCAALVVKLALDLKHFVLDYLVDLLGICKNSLKLNDKRVESAELLLDLIALHARKLTECHFNDCLRLNLGKVACIFAADESRELVVELNLKFLCHFFCV